MMSGKY
jgi:tRNA(fMet)-specific endonuclease VapC